MPKLTPQNKMSKKQLEEKLTNRVLINLAIGFAGYVFLYLMYHGVAINPYLKLAVYYPYIMLGLLVVFAAIAVLFYVRASKGEVKFKNYAHMFAAFAVISIYLNLGGINGFTGIPGVLPTWLTTTKSNYVYLSIAIAVYLIGVIVYNSSIMYISPKKQVPIKSVKSK